MEWFSSSSSPAWITGLYRPMSPTRRIDHHAIDTAICHGQQLCIMGVSVGSRLNLTACLKQKVVY